MYIPNLSELPPSPLGNVGWPWTEETPQLPKVMPDGSPWPRVSIVTPSYNQAQFLEETIRSVLLQGYPDLEYFVMDGGSTDGSVEIIQKYTPWLTGWVSEEDKGQSNAINKGFARATGRIFAWLNSDDLYMPYAIGLVAEYFAKHPEVDMVYGDINRSDENGNHIRQFESLDYNFKDLLSSRLVIPQPATFFSRRCFEAVGGLDRNLFHAMDFDLWVKIGLQFTICHLKTILAQFRVHTNAKSVAQGYTVGPELLKTLDWVFANPDLPPEIHVVRDEIYSGALMVAGVGYYASLHLSQAQASFLRAIRLHPPQIWQSDVLTLLLRTFLGRRGLYLLRTLKKKLKFG